MVTHTQLKDVGAMGEIVFNALNGYYKILGKVGYCPYKEVNKLILLSFYNNFVYEDYRGLISQSDYKEIEEALNCLFGTNCLIPYPDYLKMGKLHLGEMTELAQRVKTIEDTKVLKVIDSDVPVVDPESDIVFVESEEEAS